MPLLRLMTYMKGVRRCATAYRTLTVLVAMDIAVVGAAANVSAQEKWVASWTASAHGPYPSGFPTAAPDLQFAFPTSSRGATDQTFRLIVRPDLWGSRMRLRFSNAFGSEPVTLDGLFVGIQASGANLVPATNRAVTFDQGQHRITVAPGMFAYSDPVELSYVKSAADPELAGRKLAVSFHVTGSSGPMTWHAKALTTSYLSAPGAGAHGNDESDDQFPFSTTSWFFLDGVDVRAPEDTIVVAALGDSITDGSLSSLNGDDRWVDFLSRRLHGVLGTHVSVVNQGIGGNQVVGPATYTIKEPYGGGPSALQRFDRDVLAIPGLSVVIWLEGINDFGFPPSASAEAVVAGFREGVARLHARGIKVIGTTLTTALNVDRPPNTATTHGTPDTDAKRKIVNEFIRTSGVFDGVADFDAATLDSTTGMLRREFQPNSTIGGAGDRIHPNRAGYQAMAKAIDINLLIRVARGEQATRKDTPGR
jgi:lysophospholipase L1-like esterase